MNKFFLLIFLLSVSVIGFGNQQKFDSINALIQITNGQKELSNLEVELAWLTKYDDLNNSIAITNKAIATLEKEKDANGVAIAQSYLGVYYYLQNNFSKAVENLKAAESFFVKNSNQQRLSRIYNNLGVVYGALFDYNSSLKYYNKVLEIKNQNPEKHDISNNLINIAAIYYDQGDYKKCVATNERALVLTLSKKNYESTAIIYANLGAAHERMGNFNESKNYALKALDLYQNKVDNPLALIRTYSNLGSTYMSQNKLDDARYYYNKSLELNEKQNNEGQLNVLLNNMAELERKSGNYSKAQQLALQGLKLSETLQYDEEKMISLKTISNIEEDQGNYKNALQFYRKYIELSDSLLEISNIQKTEQQLDQNKIAMEQLGREKDQSQLELIDKKTTIMTRFIWLLATTILAWLGLIIFKIPLSITARKFVSFLTSFLITSLSVMYLFLRTNLITSLGVNGFSMLVLGVISMGVLFHLVSSRYLVRK